MSELNKDVISQRRTIMGQIDYSLKFIQSLKNQLMDVGNPHSQVNWSVGGFVMVMVSALLHQIDQTVLNPDDGEFKTAKQNLEDIQKQFNDFIQIMLSNIEN